MNVLTMGLPFCVSDTPVRLFRSERGHDVRMLAAEGGGTGFVVQAGDFTFAPDEPIGKVIKRIGREWQPDVLMCWCPELFPPPADIEDCPILTAAVVSDWNVYYPQIEWNLARYDCVLTDRPGAEQLRIPGAVPRYFQPIYSHRTPIHHPRDIERDIDVLFAGNLNHAVHIERGRYLEQVASLSDRYRIVICGGFPAEDYARLLNRARIVFNCSVRGEMNLRCFEAVASGALLFVEYSNIEVRDWLQEDEEVVFYSRRDLLDKLTYYLERPRDIERIAAQSLGRAADLAGEARLDQFLDWLALQPRGKRAFREFDAPTRSLAEIMQYASSLNEGQRSYAEFLLKDSRKEYPKRPEFVVAAGCAALEHANAHAQDERRDAARNALQHFEQACAMVPDAAVFWLNLAYVCQRAGATTTEIRCLESTLKASSGAYGGLLVGSFYDPYYAGWRKALAFGQERVEMLWAMAANRLATLSIGTGEFERAQTLAVRSGDWWREMPVPYRIAASVQRCIGRNAAALSALEESLSMTAFDHAHRLELIEVLEQTGKRARAHALAEESAALFRACWGSEAIVRNFEAHCSQA